MNWHPSIKQSMIGINKMYQYKLRLTKHTFFFFKEFTVSESV